MKPKNKGQSEPLTINTGEVLSEEEALALVESEYKSPLHVEYVVLQDGQVFYGHYKSEAYEIAKQKGIKFFDIKF